MNRRLIISFQCLILGVIMVNPCYASMWSKIIPDLNLMKVETAKNADAVVKANVGVLENAKALATFDLKVGNIEAKLNAQGAAVAGFKNDVSNLSSGRDTVQTTSNDTSLMTEMVTAYKAIICLLIAQMVGLIIQMIVLVKYIASLFQLQIMEKDKMVDRERSSRDDKDTKADVWMQKYIESVTGNKTNGLTEGQTVANDILVETLKDEAKGEVKQ